VTAHRIGRNAWGMLLLLVASCGKQPAVEPPFSDLQFHQLGGKIQQMNTRQYVAERPADMAAALASPGSWMLPADVPVQTTDGDMARTSQEMSFDRAGNLLSSRLIMSVTGPKAMHAEGLITVSRQAPGLRSLQCEMTLTSGIGGEHRFPCGRGEWRYSSPGTISRRELKSDTSDTTWEEQFDTHGRATVVDQKIVNKDGVAGKKFHDLSEHKVVQAYDAEGRVTASRGTRNGEDRYYYTLYFDPDRHGNSQRVMLLSSASADRHDAESLKRVELSTITYSYYDEIR